MENHRNVQQNSPAQQRVDQNNYQPDAPKMNDSLDNVSTERLQQSARDGEVNPEFGDAADPTQEELGNHHRDE